MKLNRLLIKLTDDLRPTSLLSYWIPYNFFETTKTPYEYGMFMTMMYELKPIDNLYRIADGEELSPDTIKSLTKKAYEAVKRHPVCPLVPFRNLTTIKCQDETQWMYVIKSKVKKLLEKLEDEYLPKDTELQPRKYYGKLAHLNRESKLEKDLIKSGYEPRRFGIYYRVSTNEQDTDSQRVEVEKYIDSLPEDQKPSSIRIYEDKGISGSKDDRPEFLNLIHDAQSGVIDTVIVYRLDRFSRSSSTAIRLLLDFEEIGVNFISITQPVLSSNVNNPFRKTLLAAFSEIAQIEREAIVMRVKAGLEAARLRGKILGRAATYTPEQKAEVLRLRAEGKKIREIVEIMNVGLSWVKSVVAKRK
ncbi:MAG: recombinase family protein [Methanobrevibacter sp.]|nr:recombinase family protein [Methanobrevibacter sp.]